MNSGQIRAIRWIGNQLSWEKSLDDLRDVELKRYQAIPGEFRHLVRHPQDNELPIPKRKICA